MIEDQAPLAIFIPVDGKASNLEFRDRDMLWDEFVAQAHYLSK